MSETVSIGALWRGWRDVLGRLGFSTAALDAKLLAGHALGLDALAMATRESEPVGADAMAQVAALIQRRISGESVARIIGEKEFYGLIFGLNAATLEPRPDTELLVDLALKALPAAGMVLDLGTGTGCIPIAILVNRPDASGWATDLSGNALDKAGRNAERHQIASRLRLRQGDWFTALPDEAGPFDLIVSNPPYIVSAVIDTLSTEVRDFDPMLALDGGRDGIAPYRVIAAQAADWLKPGGQVLVEIGYDQGEAVSALFRAAGFVDVALHQDLNGLDRVVSAHHMGGCDSAPQGKT